MESFIRAGIGKEPSLMAFKSGPGRSARIAALATRGRRAANAHLTNQRWLEDHGFDSGEDCLLTLMPGVIEAIGWTGTYDPAQVVAEAVAALEEGGWPTCGPTLLYSDSHLLRLAKLAIAERPATEQGIVEDPGPFELLVAEAEPFARWWASERPVSTDADVTAATVWLAKTLARSSEQLGASDFAIAALSALEKAGLQVKDGAALLPAERAAAAVIRGLTRLTPLERDRIEDLEANLQTESDFTCAAQRTYRAERRQSLKWQRRALKKGAQSRLARSAPPLPMDLESEPGILGDLARWSLASAFRPVREFAVPSALAVLSPIFGRRFVTPTGSGLNLYMVALANTGSGKEAALAAPQAMLDAAGLGYLLGPGDVTSDTAIETSLRYRPCQLMPLDEFGQFVQAVQGRNAPAFSKSVRKSMLEVYSKSGPGGRHTGKQKAGDGVNKAAEPIYSPTLTILGCSTVEGFFEGLTEENFSDGFINRLLVIRGGAPGPRNMSHARLIPSAEVVQALQAVCEASSAGEGNLSATRAREATVKPDLRHVPWKDAEATAAWEAVAEWQDVAEENGRGGVTARAAEHVLKVATIRALSRAAGDPAVAVDDVRWAWGFVQASIATVEEGARQNMAGIEFEAGVKTIERAVVAAGSEGLTNANLLRAKGVSKLPPRIVEEALKRLEDTNRIDRGISKPPGGGHPRYRIIATTFTRPAGVL